MKTAVIVINYGVAELAAAAIDSVLAMTGERVDVHLVDNASPGDDAARLTEIYEARGWDGKVKLWLESKNHGFGEGNNVVLRALAEQDVPPDYVFLLNPDAVLSNDAISALVAVLEANPKAGAAGAALVESDGAPTAAAFRFPSLASELDRVIDFGPVARLLKNFRVALPPDLPAGPVDWVSGAAVMFRFEALQEVGFFDSDFFLYYEEVDLMRRLGAAGWHVLHVPEAQVLHHEGASTGVRSANEVRRQSPPYLYQSWQLYFSKSLGWGGALALALILVPAATINILQCRLRGRQPSLPAHFFRDHWSYAIRPLITRRAS